MSRSPGAPLCAGWRRRASSSGSASAFLAACGGVEGTDERATGRRRPPSTTRRSAVGTVTFSQLAAVHRQGRHPAVGEAGRRQAEVRRGLQRQRGVLRQGPPASWRPASRSGATSWRRPTGWPRAGSTSATSSRSTRRTCPTRENLRQPQEPAVRHESRLHAAVAVRHHRRSATTRRRPARSSRASTTSSTRSSRAVSRCSPTGATRLA